MLLEGGPCSKVLPRGQHSSRAGPIWTGRYIWRYQMSVRGLLITLVFGALFSVAGESKAQVDGWLFCDNCVTADQFKQAARSYVTRTGDYQYAVGNRNTASSCT